MAEGDKLTSQQFAAKIRAKYPGAYDSISDDDLTSKIIAKYPEYGDHVSAPTGGVLSPEEQERSRTLSNMTAAMSGRPMAHPEDQAEFDKGRQAGFGAGAATIGSVAAPAAIPAVSGLTGVALRTGLATAGAVPGVAAGQQNPSPGSVTEEAALKYGLPHGAGETVGYLTDKLAPLAQHALARVLRLTPKAFEFGREPVHEVLEQGLAKGTVPEMAKSIEAASKQTTSQLNEALEGTKGTVNAENHAIDVSNTLPGTMGNRFLKVVDDAMEKLKLRSNQLSSLTPAQTNELKQEVARQAKFVEGDAKASVASAGKMFGGKLKDDLIALNPNVKDLLETSANLTEASKGANLAVRAEKAGRGSGITGGVTLNKPSTYGRAIDTPTRASTVFRIANMLKDSGVPISAVLRTAFGLAYPTTGEE